jgi:hypothetical protein
MFFMVLVGNGFGDEIRYRKPPKSWFGSPGRTQIKIKRILHKFNDKSELEDMQFEMLQKPIVSGRSGWLTKLTSI